MKQKLVLSWVGLVAFFAVGITSAATLQSEKSDVSGNVVATTVATQSTLAVSAAVDGQETFTISGIAPWTHTFYPTSFYVIVITNFSNYPLTYVNFNGVVQDPVPANSSKTYTGSASGSFAVYVQGDGVHSKDVVLVIFSIVSIVKIFSFIFLYISAQNLSFHFLGLFLIYSEML